MGQCSASQDETGILPHTLWRSRKLRVLEHARRLAVLTGVVAFTAWALIGHWTSWVGIRQRCKNASSDGRSTLEFQWNQVSQVLSHFFLFLVAYVHEK
jgi:hypothetical protein